MIISDTHKKFITNALIDLENYDSQRPLGHAYQFHSHSERVAQTMKKLALKMGYDSEMAETLYWVTLPHDMGKMAFDIPLWDYKDSDGKPTKPPEEIKMIRRRHTTEGINFMQQTFGDNFDTDPVLKLMADLMENHHEAMNGSGFLGKTGDQLSREVRMLCIVDAADGWSIIRPHKKPSDVTPDKVYNKMSVTNAGQFDPEILSIFKEIILCPSKHSLSQQPA